MKEFLKRVLPPRLVLFIKKLRYTSALRNVSETAEPDMVILKHLMGYGDYAIDLGANMGWYTKYMSELVGTNGGIIAIEPIPATYEILVFMKNRLHLTNVHPMNYAISDKPGVVQMEIPSTASGDANIYEARIVNSDSKKAGKVVNVEARTLDRICNELNKPVVFVKCDVEGHELQCLRGSTTLLSRFHPSWLIEIWGDPDDTHSTSHQTIDLFSSYGYRSYLLDGSMLRHRKPHERSKSQNYFFLTEEQAMKLQAKGVLARMPDSVHD